MDVGRQSSTSTLIKAVESLKAAGLSGIGSVVQTTSPEYFDATTFSEGSYLVQTTFDDDGESLLDGDGDADYETKKLRRNSNYSSSEDDMSSASIHIFSGSISNLGSTDTFSRSGLGYSIASANDIDMETISSDENDNDNDDDVDVTISTATTATKSLTPLTSVNVADLDSLFTIEASTNHCARGKKLWADGKCQAALSEFRKALLGLELILGTNHLLVSKLYYWMGQIFLRLLDDNENYNFNDKNGKQQIDAGMRRRAWTDAAVESLAWSLKIRYTQAIDGNSNNNNSNNKNTESVEDSEANETAMEVSLARAWKFQAEEWPLSSSRPQRSNNNTTLENLKDSIKIERKADLALFRLEKNQLSQAIDVYVSLVHQYNKAISACSDDGNFSAMTKMAFWYHKLGRLRATMEKENNADGASIPSFHSLVSMPLDNTEHTTTHYTYHPPTKRSRVTSVSRTYLEHAAFWYRMALEVFCTSIGRFDKTTSEIHNKNENNDIDITTHPTYKQLLLRLGQVLLDHYKSDNNNNNKHRMREDYLRSLGVGESVFQHFGAKQAMMGYQRLSRTNKSNSMSRLQVLKDHLTKAREGYFASVTIEESAWGVDHKIVLRMRHELGRANRFREIVELEITSFPAKQAQRQQQKEEEEMQRQQKEQQQEQPDFLVRNGIDAMRWLEDQVHHPEQSSEEEIAKKDPTRASPRSKTEEDVVMDNIEILSLYSKEAQQQQKQKQQKQKQQKQKRQKQKQQKQKSPSGSTAFERIPSNGIETLRRLQDQIYQSQQLLEGQTTEKEELRAQLQSKSGEILEAMATAARKEEEAVQWKQNCMNAQSKQEALQNRTKKLENKIKMSEQKQGQLEFTMKKEGANLAQSATQKEVELEYWKQRFEVGQTEWTESETRLEEKLRSVRTDAGSKEAELIEWRGRFEGLDGGWKTRQEQVERLEQENEHLMRAVASGMEEQKQLEFSKKMNDLEFAQSKEEQVLDAMTKAARSDSEAVAWKRKFDVAQKEWLAMHDRADEQAREAIADATGKTAELARWKKKFEIAQREWMECQTKAESHARGAIATAKRYEVSHSELTKKFTAAQKGLKNLLHQNRQLRQQVVDSQSKQDQLEFSLKKQVIDFAQFQETLNRKTVEAQCWKEQCQASQQAQKQISHEIQLSRVTDGSLHDRIVDLRQQNADLKGRNTELVAEQEHKKLELEAKNKEVATVKEAALIRIRQLKKEQRQLQHNVHIRDQSKEGAINSGSPKPETNFATNGALRIEDETKVDLSDPSSLAAKLGRTQRALQYVEKDHKDSLEEMESLTKAKKEMEGNIADAQKIISLLKTANNERIEQCSKLESEKNQIQRQLDELLNESRQELITELRKELDKSIADKKALAAQVKSLESQIGERYSDDTAQELTNRISFLESDLQKSELRNKALLSDVNNNRLQSFSPSTREWSRSDDDSPEEDEQRKTLSDRCEKLERELCVSNHQVEDLKDQVRDYTERSDSVSGKQEYHDMIVEQDLEQSVQDDNEKIRILSKCCQELERDLVISNHQVEDLQDELRECRDGGDISDGKQEYHDMVLAQDLERELEESNMIRENVSSKLEMCEEKIVLAEEKEREFKRKLDFSNHQIKKLRESVRDFTKGSLSQRFDGKQDDHQLTIMEDIEHELEESNEIREKLSSELKACKEKVERAEEKEKEFQWLTREHKQLEEKLEESSQIREEMSTQLNSLKKRLARAEEKEDESDVVEDKLSELEQQLEESSNKNKRLQSQLDNLTSTAGSEDKQRRFLVNQVSALEKELGDSTKEIKSLEKEIEKLEKVFEDIKNVEDVEEEKEELMEKYRKLEKLYQDTKEEAEQNSKSLSVMLEVESNEKERVRQECTELKKDLEKISKRKKQLEFRVDEMVKRNINSLSDSTTSCNQCLVLGDELRSTIEQNDKHILATERFQDDHDQLLDRYNILKKELKETMELNESLESQLIAKEKNARDETLDNDDKYQDLNVRCIELEEELRDANDLKDKKTAQIDALRKKIVDLEAYADDTASDLEQAESIIGALKAEGAGGGGEVTLLLDRCNKLQRQLKESKKASERLSNDLDNSQKENVQNSQKENVQMKEEMGESLDNLVVNINVEDTPPGTANEEAVQELNAKLDAVTTDKEELETLLKKATEDIEQQKRLKGHVEKDRDYLDKMYNDCKSDMTKVQSDIDATKDLLKKSDDEKEELERKLQIEKHVSHSLKTNKNNADHDESEENELEELYRQARDELSEVESMLFETEEELEALKSKYEKLQEKNNHSIDSGESDHSSEIVHDLEGLSRDELVVETKKTLRKLQETQTKLVDLQETNMILQAQLKSSLTFKERSKTPVKRNNGGRGGFWSLGGGDGGNKTNDTNKTNDDETKNVASEENKNNGNTGVGRFWGLRGGARGGDASNEKGGDEVAGN